MGEIRIVLRWMLGKLYVRIGGRWNLFRIIYTEILEFNTDGQVKSQW